MSTQRVARADVNETLEDQLRRLRLKIDLLPESQRPHLIDLASTIARQHRKLQKKVPQNHDADWKHGDDR